MTLRDDTLYLGDNGRAVCGTLRCAGMTAYYSGQDISGQSVTPLQSPTTIRLAIKQGVMCEGCGKQPALVTV